MNIDMNKKYDKNEQKYLSHLNFYFSESNLMALNSIRQAKNTAYNTVLAKCGV